MKTNNEKNKKSLVSERLSNNLSQSVFAKPKTGGTKVSVVQTSDLENTLNNEMGETSERGTMAPQVDTTAPDQTTNTPINTTNEATPGIDVEKLKTIIEEISQIGTKSNGLNVRLSEQEALDIEEFIQGTLRKKGLRGADVSATKLMRYAFRYLLRVHEKDFIEALVTGLKKDNNLSI